MVKFDYENFDYEKVYQEVEAEIKKPNILICGASQVGKSSLINDFFDLQGAEQAKVGNAGTATTRKIKLYSSADINLYDSEGYEVGAERQQYYMDEIISFIDKQKKNFPEDMSRHIHEVWYCISAGNKRFLELDKKLISIISDKKIPVMIVLTKVDCVSEEELNEMKQSICEEFSQLDIFTYSTALCFKNKSEEDEGKTKYVQKQEMIDWALIHLEESLRSGFMPVVRGGIKVKRNYIISKVIPKYALIAGTVCTATSFVPVPFSDSVPLMGIQVKMATEIFKVFGMEKLEKKIVVDIVGTQFVSYFGKCIAKQLFRVIPGVGNVALAAANVTTSTTITATLGMAITYLAEQYLKECVNQNGSENISVFQYFTAEQLKKAVDFVKQNEETGEYAAYKIGDIIGEVLEKLKGNKR